MKLFKKNNILVIGSIPHKGKPQTFGGTTVLMEDYLLYLKERNIKYKFISSNSYTFKGASLINFIIVFFKIIYYTPLSKIVMINSARNGAFLLGPILYSVTKVFRKKFVFRMFGGNLLDLLENSSKIKRFFFTITCLKADLIYVETKKIQSKLLTTNPNVLWFPNVRKVSQPKFKEKEYKKRFVFISHVKKTKGVGVIIEAFNKLPINYTIDIYGPIKDNVLNEYKINSNIKYIGSLQPSEVLSTLSNYDFLILPTFHTGEGYPGIIIESYSQGIPVITTLWQSIPEIVDNNTTGILIKPNNVNQLVEAIKSIDDINYSEISRNAYYKFQEFSSAIVNKRITYEILNLIEK